MIYLIFYQSTLSPINISNMYNMKGFSTNRTEAKTLLYNSLLKLNKIDGKDYLGIIIAYPENTILKLDKIPNKEVEGYTCIGGICQYTINIPITLQPPESKLLINLQKNKITHGCSIN